MCFDAGKPEGEYTSHYVKDVPGPNGKVICPTLLSIECRYCHAIGHTKKHCQKLRSKNERKAHGARSHRAGPAPRVSDWLAAASKPSGKLSGPVPRPVSRPRRPTVAIGTPSRFQCLDTLNTPPPETLAPRAVTPPPPTGAWSRPLVGLPAAAARAVVSVKRPTPPVRPIAPPPNWADAADDDSDSLDGSFLDRRIAGLAEQLESLRECAKHVPTDDCWLDEVCEGTW